MSINTDYPQNYFNSNVYPATDTNTIPNSGPGMTITVNPVMVSSSSYQMIYGAQSAIYSTNTSYYSPISKPNTEEWFETEEFEPGTLVEVLKTALGQDQDNGSTLGAKCLLLCMSKKITTIATPEEIEVFEKFGIFTPPYSFVTLVPFCFRGDTLTWPTLLRLFDGSLETAKKVKDSGCPIYLSSYQKFLNLETQQIIKIPSFMPVNNIVSGVELLDNKHGE
jgi:hypothetical protein